MIKRSTKIVVMMAFILFFFVGTIEAQRRGRQRGKRIQELTVVISQVDEATIGYQVERRGRLRTQYIGIASVTKITKNGKDASIKDLEKTDKVVVTLYKDPDDPYFPALAVKVIGKGELKKARRRGKKGKKSR